MKSPLEIWKQSPERLLSKAYDHNLEWCKRYVEKNSGTREDAADVFQESISVAWHQLKEGKFQGDVDQFNAYIRQICKYKWINELKAASRKTVRLEGNLSTVDWLVDPQQAEDDSSQIKLLQASFAAIGDKCKELLGRFYFKRQSLSALAQQMGMTDESMKTTKYRCMMRLRKAYLERAKENEEA